MYFLAVYFAVAVISAVVAFRITDRPAPASKKTFSGKAIWPVLPASLLGLVLLKTSPSQNMPEVGLPFSMHLAILLVAFSAGWFIGVIARSQI